GRCPDHVRARPFRQGDGPRVAPERPRHAREAEMTKSRTRSTGRRPVKERRRAPGGGVPGVPRIVEMGTYKIKPGRRTRFLEIWRTKSMPAHAEIGMKIVGPFESIEDPDTFFFMRGFPDLESREPMKAKFYEGELWTRELEHVLMPMIEKYDVVLVDDPDG